MSLLVLIPPADRLPARADAGDAGAAQPRRASLRWVWGDEGGEPTLSTGGSALRSGMDGLDALPAATQRLLVLPPSACSWHRLKCPKVPTAKLPLALQGALEDQLLAEPEQVHLALEPGAKPGETVWVAAIDRSWLSAWLAELEAAGLIVDRVVPGACPRQDDTVQAHLSAPDVLDSAPWQWLWSSPHGAGVWPWDEAANASDLDELPWATTARTALPPSSAAIRDDAAQEAPSPVQWSANAGAMRWAGEHLGPSVTLLSDAQWWMAAAQTGSQAGWECRQFDLAPRHAGLRAGRRGWQTWSSAAWRPVRWGLAALVTVQLAGIAWAGWQQSARIQQLQQAQRQVMQQAFPSIKTLIDAPLQMRRETEALLQAAGEPGPEDFETALAAAALAWPPAATAAWNVQLDGRSLTLKVQNWTPEQTRSFQQALRAQGWDASEQAGVLRLTRRAAGS